MQPLVWSHNQNRLNSKCLKKKKKKSNKAFLQKELLLFKKGKCGLNMEALLLAFYNWMENMAFVRSLPRPLNCPRKQSSRHECDLHAKEGKPGLKFGKRAHGKHSTPTAQGCFRNHDLSIPCYNTIIKGFRPN